MSNTLDVNLKNHLVDLYSFLGQIKMFEYICLGKTNEVNYKDLEMDIDKLDTWLKRLKKENSKKDKS